MSSVELPTPDSALPDHSAQTDSTQPVHHPLIITLHWLTLAALLVAVSAVLLRGIVDGRILRLELLNLHRSMGLLILIAAGCRLALRQTLKRPVTAHDTPQVLQLLATLSHSALYVLIIALPMLGWALTSARGQTARLLGLIPLPSLVASNPDLSDTLADWHLWGAWVLLALVVTHAGAALWHHHVRRDQVLLTMLPKRRIKS